MKSLIFATVLLLSTNSVFADAKRDYHDKIVSAYKDGKPISSLVIEAINKGILSPNETFTKEEGYYQNSKLIDLIISPISDIEPANFTKVTKDNTIALKFMLEHGLDISSNTKKEHLLLNSAAACNLDSVKLLVKYGANPAVNHTDPQFNPPITSESGNGATASFGEFFGETDQLDEGQEGYKQSFCLDTFKYFVEEVKIDVSKYECKSFETLENRANSDYPSELSLYNYIISKYGPNFDLDCEALYYKQYKDAGWEL